MKTLFIDTSSNTSIIVGLRIDGTEDLITHKIDTRKAQIALPLIEQLLKKHQLTPQDLTGIEVQVGPGSFTGLRVGITIANTLGSELQIPVNGQKSGELVQPVYS